jgi:signal transduction histidine kinase
MAQAVKSLEELRKKLLTNLAHELRTPLTSISRPSVARTRFAGRT